MSRWMAQESRVLASGAGLLAPGTTSHLTPHTSHLTLPCYCCFRFCFSFFQFQASTNVQLSTCTAAAGVPSSTNSNTSTNLFLLPAAALPKGHPPLEMADTDEAGMARIFDHFRKSLRSPLKISDAISIHLNAPVLDWIAHNQWSSLAGPHNADLRAGFLLSVVFLANKKLTADVKIAAQKLVNLAANDENEYVRSVAHLVSARLNKGHITVALDQISPKFADAMTKLKEAVTDLDLKFHPLETPYLDPEVIRTLYPGMSVAPAEDTLHIRTESALPATHDRRHAIFVKADMPGDDSPMPSASPRSPTHPSSFSSTPASAASRMAPPLLMGSAGMRSSKSSLARSNRPAALNPSRRKHKYRRHPAPPRLGPELRVVVRPT
ncbi:hypothetical protein BDK51DRAFT_38779 [Blyttiomyces helicus]|uniref:NELF-A N-terminal domain-containing protein n=1 Tax=Blyttiomyces helicus TaxID=388810 RepID=A0A4P9WDE0_9FUNG|nr:hypothetical protein BDK51DRAFT_38779 [Blyttiomyces helicus]|eukprot:RKO90362.1 hypothetical protein BDK51DRAFT_38779 [Blyttiomyces helicus]